LVVGGGWWVVGGGSYPVVSTNGSVTPTEYRTNRQRQRRASKFRINLEASPQRRKTPKLSI
jgi:hypothetical protein